MAQTSSTFPSVYANISTDELIRIYAAAPERLNALLKGLSVHELQEHAKPGKWSIQEIAIHLADAEIMGAARIRQAFAEPGSNFAAYEQEIWAKAFDYQGFDSKAFFSAVMLFDSLRLNTTKIFHRAATDDWNKFGNHPHWGKLTLRQLLELYADHGERHIHQILELRILVDKPMEFDLLLTKRLY